MPLWQGPSRLLCWGREREEEDPNSLWLLLVFRGLISLRRTDAVPT